MEHLSNDELAALALVGDPESKHLDACAACRDEIASLRRAAERYRAADVPALTPPAGIWDRIAAEITDDGALASSPATATLAPAPAPAPRASAHVARRRRRRFSTGALLAACAASAAVAASVAVLLIGQLGGIPRSTDVANAVLDPLESTVSVAPARAEVIERDGQRLLVVDVESLPQVDGYLDVWLLDTQAQQMVSLGVMDAESTQLSLPPGLDLATYPIVDVSIEPFDGDPTHSGNSIWRGALEL
ncbi:anti-sigma factor [Agrococcus sp. ProA11]|uniref:anti-sigma factor n=1 Tax=Agrococcus chionoecetis TaxID=3153752 RepID=UPI003260A4C0